MMDWSDEESYESLAEHRLGRSGLLVKLDRGFEPGDYGVCIQYDGLADKIAFTAARRPFRRERSAVAWEGSR
ncbi:MAG: hypothetical protein ACRELG_12965 [Gemmataceae bacterium]